MEITSLKRVDITKEITHPGTGENIGIRVTIMSPNDKRLKRVIRRITDQNLQKNKRGKGIKAEDIEENQLELISNALTGWEWYGDATFQGEKPEFTVENVKKVCKEFPEFMEQIDEEMGDTSRFFDS